MKLPCKYCGKMPKYRYDNIGSSGKRVVYLECRNACSVPRSASSDPTALKCWNEENAR